MYVPIDCAPAQINWNLSLQNGAEHWLRSDKIIWPKIILEMCVAKFVSIYFGNA